MPKMVEDRSNGYVKMVPVLLPTIEELHEESKRLRQEIKFRVTKENSVCKPRSEAVLRFYGLTKSQFEQMFLDQGGKCAICEQIPTQGSLAIDHDHRTGKVRGLLCRGCNMGLGHFGDNIPRLASALNYLRNH